MKDYIAVIKNSNNKVDKYQDFDSRSDANAHVATNGGFVVENPGGSVEYWVVDADAKTVTFNKSASDTDTARIIVMSKIFSLEAEVTPRRLRDAVLTSDGKTWLANKEAEIATERAKL
jgi:hypothetical protein